MELEFENRQAGGLRAVFDRVVAQEETGEAIVPDQCPDARSTAGCFGTVVLRSKECRDGSVLLSGGVYAYALCVPEDGSQTRAVSAYLPFTQRVDAPEATSASRVIYTPRLRALDARLVNSRKVLIRADVSARVEVYEPDCTEVYEPPEDLPACVQLHRVTLPVTRTEQSAEKAFELGEELELPGGVPACAALLKWDCGLSLTESRTIGARVVFKGAANVRLLCSAPDGALFRYEFSLPFSQYADLDRESGEEAPRVELLLTGAQLVPDGQEPARRFLLTLNLLAQCVTQTREELSLVDDAYTTRGELTVQTAELAASGQLDCEHFHQAVRVSIPGACREVLDVTVLLGWPETAHEDEAVSVRVPATVRVLCLDETGAPVCRTAPAEAVCGSVLAPGCEADAAAALTGDAFAVPGGEGCEARFGVDITLTSRAQTVCSMVTGAELTEREDEPERPSVIVRPAHCGETLWSVAKACRAELDAVRAANDVGDEIAPGTLLLIPRA